MKKFLSLVLALVMTMSLVTISAGAKDFTDDSKITYKEAVDVISAVKVVDGYTDGSFNPNATLTRGAAAKIICNLILGPTTASALKADAAPYSDVPANSTFAGYIAYCAKEGIVGGYADGTFKPGNTLTGYAFMKMLLGALGYDKAVEGYEGSNWSINVAKRALNIGLDKGLVDNFDGTKPVTREEAALYAFNTLKATMVEYDNNSSITVGDIVITNSSKAEDVWNYATTETIKSDDKMQFAEKYFTNLKKISTTDAFGRPATEWKIKSTTVGTYADKADATYTEGVKFGTIYNDLGLSKGIAVADVTSYVDGTEQGAIAADIYKGNTTNSFGGNGVLTEVYYDADDNSAVVTMINTYIGKVVACYAATSTKDAYVAIEDKTSGGGSVYTTDDTYTVGEYVKYTYSNMTGNTGIKSMEVAEKVAGDLTAYTVKKSVTIDGTKYSVNDVTASKNTITSALQNAMNTECTVYLDDYGYALWVDATAASDAYAVVIGTNAVGSGSGTLQYADKAELLLLDGTRKVVNVTDDTVIGTDPGEIAVNDIVTYKVNSKGNYKLTLVADFKTEKMHASNNVKFVTKGTSQLANPASGHPTFGITGDVDLSTANLYANGKTVFLFWNPTTKTVQRYVGIANVPDFTVTGNQNVTYSAYSASTAANYYAKVFFAVLDANATMSSTSKDVIFIKGSSTDESHNDALNDYYTYDAIVNGEITTITTTDKVSEYTLATGLTKNSDDVYDTNTTTGLVLGTNGVDENNTSGTDLVYGTATDAAVNGTITLAGNVVSVADDCKVFRISHDKKEIFASSVASIQKDTNDLVWYKTTDGEVTTIVIQIVDDAPGAIGGNATYAFGAVTASEASGVDVTLTDASFDTVPTTVSVKIYAKTFGGTEFNELGTQTYGDGTTDTNGVVTVSDATLAEGTNATLKIEVYEGAALKYTATRTVVFGA